MDESDAMKRLELNEKGGDTRDNRICDVMISIEGFDTSRPVDEIKDALRKHFASCGEITRIDIPINVESNTLNRYALIYFVGKDAEEKALKLNGSDVGGWTAVVEVVSGPTPAYYLRESRLPKSRISMVSVTGYDTSLPAADIEKALINHFSSCGEITNFAFVPGSYPETGPPNSRALIYIKGQDGLEKALGLSGTDMGGRKVVAKAAYSPHKPNGTRRRRGVHGYTVPEWIIFKRPKP